MDTEDGLIAIRSSKIISANLLKRETRIRYLQIRIHDFLCFFFSRKEIMNFNHENTVPLPKCERRSERCENGDALIRCCCCKKMMCQKCRFFLFCFFLKSVSSGVS